MTTETACLQFTSISKSQNYADLFVTFEVSEMKVGSQAIVDRTITFTWEWVDPDTIAERSASRKFHVRKDEGNAIYRELRALRSKPHVRGVDYTDACLVYARLKHEVNARLADLQC